MEDLPALGSIGNRPEAQEASVFPGAGHEFLQSGAFPGRDGAPSTPFEMVRPLIADQGNEMSGGLAAEIAGTTVEGTVAGGIGLHEASWSSTAQDCGDRSRAGLALEVGGEKGAVAGEELVEDRVGFVPIGLDIDEQDESKVSIMPEGLLNTMTRDEILDLIAYIISGANPEHPAFRQ